MNQISGIRNSRRLRINLGILIRDNESSDHREVKCRKLNSLMREMVKLNKMWKKNVQLLQNTSQNKARSNRNVFDIVVCSGNVDVQVNVRQRKIKLVLKYGYAKKKYLFKYVATFR